MKGLDAEFQRFREQALGDLPPEDINGAENIFMCGAMAASQRILDIIFSGLPDIERSALLRRVQREAIAYQQRIKRETTEA